MSSSLALISFVMGIGGLFFLDRDSSVRTSKAIWLPVIWLWINGSRTISTWLGITTKNDSPIDQLVAGAMIVVGLVVIARRHRESIAVIRRSWPLAVYFSYCILSVIWSDFPAQGSKRWIRALGDLIMALVLATEAQPAAAIKRFFSRVGFILLPMSVLLIRYYPGLGRGYDDYGLEISAGVTTNKNTLGVITFVLALAPVWQLIVLLRDRNRPNRGRRLLSQSALLCFGISLLFTAHSATSGACFTLGTALMVITALPLFRRYPGAVHAVALVMLLGGSLIGLIGGREAAAKAVGRNADFTGRTVIWDTLVPMATHPFIGFGFENFWFGPRLESLTRMYPGINEAHNGYLEVYLNLGSIGVGLIALILVRGYAMAVTAFRSDPALGSLLLAYVFTAAFYGITEAGFRMLNPIWFCLILSILAASRLTAIGNELLPSHQVLSAPALGPGVGPSRFHIARPTAP